MGKEGVRGRKGRRVDAQRPRAETAPTRQTAHLDSDNRLDTFGPSVIEPAMRMARSAVRQSIRDDVGSLLTTKGRMPLPVPRLMDVQGGQGKVRMAVCATWTAGRLDSSTSSRFIWRKGRLTTKARDRKRT